MEEHSPFCPRCLDFGDLRHTYKVAGRPIFKCGTCKKIFEKEMFKPEEISWKHDLKTWETFMGKKLSKQRGNIREELERLRGLSVK